MAKRKMRTPSIINNLTTALTATVITVSLIVSIFLAVNELKKSRIELTAKAQESAAYLVHILELPIWNVDDKTVNIIGETFGQDQRITRLMITGSHDKVIYELKRGGRTNDIYNSDGVFHNGMRIGYVEIFYSTESYTDVIINQIRNIIIINLMVILSIFLAASALIRFFLKTPLRQFSEVVNSYALDDYSFSVDRVPFIEFEAFGRVLEKMGNQILGQLSELRALNREMEEASHEKDILIDEINYSEEKYRSLFENAQDSIFVIDMKKGMIIDVNPSACELYGYKREEMINLSAAAVTAEPEESIKSLEGKIAKIPVRYHRKKDGTVFPVEITMNTFRQSGMDVIVGFARDITERKNAEEALKASENKYRRLHESMIDGFAYVNMDGFIMECNLSFELMLGYSFKELLCLSYQDITPEKWHETENKILIEQVLQRGYSDVYEKEYIRKDGSVFPVELRTFLLQNENGQNEGMWAIIRDITERKLAEDRLKKSLLEKEILLKEIHHRVKNNLSIIYSLLHFQKKNTGDSSMLSLITNLQSRIQSISLIHQKLYRSDDLSSIDFNEYCRDLISGILYTHEEKTDKISLRLNIMPVRLDISVVMPCGLILNELITNTLKHAFPGDKKGVIAVDFQYDKDYNCSLSYSDTGIGIPDLLDLKMAKTMGIFIIRSFVQQLHGNLNIDNQNGFHCAITFKIKPGDYID